MGDHRGPRRVRQAGPPGLSATEPCSLRAGRRSRPGRDHPGPGSGPTPGPPSAPTRPDGRFGIRVLSRGTGRDGLRPVDDADQPDHRPGERRRTPVELRAVRFAGTNAGLRFERLRRDAPRAVGVGRQAPRRERGHRVAQQRVHAGEAPARPSWRRSPRIASRWPRYSGMRLLDIWYDRTTADDIVIQLTAASRILDGRVGLKEGKARVDAIFAKARGKDQMKASGLADGGGRREVAHPRRSARRPAHRAAGRPDGPCNRPSATIGRPSPRTGASSSSAIGSWISRSRSSASAASGRAASWSCSRVATKGDPLFLQAKEATASVMAPYLDSSSHTNHGERVVVGQRLMQATPDIFLGWTRGPGGRDFYFRQLWDMKGSVDTTTLQAPGMGFYGGLCARSLARAHARSGDSIAIASYLGTSTRSTARSRISRRRTPTRTTRTTRPSRPPSTPARSRQRPADGGQADASGVSAVLARSAIRARSEAMFASSSSTIASRVVSSVAVAVSVAGSGSSDFDGDRKKFAR